MELKFISLKVIIDRIMMSPLYNSIRFDSAILWAVDIINLIEVPEFFREKSQIIKVEDYRCLLPYDYVTITKINLTTDGDGLPQRKAMKTSSDPYLKGYPLRKSSMDQREVELDYRVEGDYLYTGIESGTIEVAYKALPLDSDNYIMIPDNIFIIRAVESYIKLQYLKILYDMDEITRDKVESMEVDYVWAIGQAQAQRQFENLDKLESVKNAISRLVLLKNVHETDYRYATSKKYRRI